MEAMRPYSMKQVIVKTGVVDAAQNIAINGQTFMIANSGAQPLYINPKTTATASNGFLIPANTTMQQFFTCEGNLSVISNATGTTVSILILDL